MFLSDEEYSYVIGLMDGTVRKSPLLEELADWAKQELGLDVYAFFCNDVRTDIRRLRIILWEIGEYEKQKLWYYKENKRFGLNDKVQEKFQKEFAILARKFCMYPEYQDGRNFMVSYETIRDEIAKRIIKANSVKIRALALGHRDIWKIELIFGSVHIFYETDEQVQQHEADGVNSGLRQSCTDIVRGQDKFGAFSDGVSCVFTSKQTLDEKYAGSMFHYTR